MLRKRLGAALVATLVVWMLQTGCGNVQTSATEDNTFKVALFVDRSFGDRAFFDVGLEGLHRIKNELDAQVTTYEGQLKPENFANQLRDAARRHDLVFVMGFEGIDAMISAAEQYPETHFVFIDAAIDHPSITSVVYKDEQGCFLAGSLAAAMATQVLSGPGDPKVVGFVGGMDAPVIRRCEAGFFQGARKVSPEVRLESVIIGSFSDPAKGREANQILFDRGSRVNFQYAGLSGEGGFQLAKELNDLYVIGAGTDQTFLAPDKVLGNMLKRVDESMMLAAKEYLNGTLEKGKTYYGDLSNGQLAMTLNEMVPPDIRALVNDLRAQIQNGQIEVTAGQKG